MISSESASPAGRLAVQQLGRQFGALFEPIAERGGPSGVERFPHPLDDRRGAGVGLEVSAAAAAAEPGVGGEVDDHVAAFGAVAVLAVDREVADDDAAADAGAQGEEDHAVEVAARADPELAVGGGAGVVGEGDRQPAMLGDPVADGEIVPALEVHRVDEFSGGDVHRAGRTEPDAGQVGRF